jgi:hypothetical protein
MADFLSSLFNTSANTRGKEEAEALARANEERASVRDTALYEEMRQNRLNEEINSFFAQREADAGGYKDKDRFTSNISRQIAHIKNMGLYARPTRFAFDIHGLGALVNERLNRNCMSTSIPGRSIQSQPYKIYGPAIEYAYEANYTNELSMVFRVGEDMFERDFFEGWMGSIISPLSGDLQYPDNYRTTMRIYQLDRRDNKVYAVELYNLFCKSVGEMELSTDSSDQISTINVSLAFSEYQTIGKVNFWYDPRRDRGPSEPTRTTQALVNEQIRKQDIDSQGFKQAMGDLNFILEQQ